MTVDVPVHVALSALLLLLPFAWFWWRSVARRYTAQPWIANALTPGLLLFGNVLVTHVVGLATGRFYTGLILAIAVPGVLGSTLWLRSRRMPRTPVAAREPIDGRYATALVVALVSMIPVVVLFDVHDTVHWIGHMATASQIGNGIYPPRSMSSADRVWIYHYAVDQLFASVTALLRLPLNLAIDLTALALWLYTAHLFGILCRLLFGRPWDSLGVLVGSFTGGLPWLASWDLPSEPGELQSIYTYAGYWSNPPLASNFLQYPWALGMPAILFVLLVLGVELGRTSPDRKARLRGLAMLGLALATLSVSQVAGFVALFVALGIWTLASALRDPRRNRDLLLGLGALLVAIGALLPLLGGMLGPLVVATGHDWLAWAGVVDAPTSRLESHIRFWRPVPLLDKLRWNLAGWGVLPLGVLCLVQRREPAVRSLLALMVILFVVSFLVLNLLYYGESWDIVKFACAGSIPLAVLSVGAVQAAIASAAGARAIRRRLALAGVAVWIALLFAAGLLFHAGVLVEAVAPPRSVNRMPALWRVVWSETATTAGDDAAIGWLRRHIQPGEMVLCEDRLELACAIFGGFPQPTISTLSHLGFGEAEQLRLILLESARTPEDYLAIDVCWAIRAIPSDRDPRSAPLRFGTAGSPVPAVVRLCPDSPAPAR